MLSTHVKRVSQHSAESRGFSPGAPVSSQGSCMTGWVRVSQVKISIVMKIAIVQVKSKRNT